MSEHSPSDGAPAEPLEPILPGLFEPTGDGRLRLCATRGGGVTLFPRREATATAGPEEVEDVLLDPEAVVHSWTVSHVPTSVAIAQVRFADGPFVQGYLDGDPQSPPEIGEVVDVVPYPVAIPGTDEQALTYAFRRRSPGRSR